MSTSILIELCKCLVIHPATYSGLSVTLTTSISMSLSVSSFFEFLFQPTRQTRWALFFLATVAPCSPWRVPFSFQTPLVVISGCTNKSWLTDWLINVYGGWIHSHPLMVGLCITPFKATCWGEKALWHTQTHRYMLERKPISSVFFLLLFCHHRANKAAAVAAGKKRVFPPAGCGCRKCDAAPPQVVSIAIAAAASLSIFITQLFCLSFFHSSSFSRGVWLFFIYLFIGTGCCRIEAPPPPPSSSSLPPSSLDTLYLCSLTAVINSRVCFGSLLPAGGPSVGGGGGGEVGVPPPAVPGRHTLPNTSPGGLVGRLHLDRAGGDSLIYLFTMYLLLAYY